MSQRSLLAIPVLLIVTTLPLQADDLRPGTKAPDFSAAGLDGRPSRLSERFGADGTNVVLVFSRGHW